MLIRTIYLNFKKLKFPILSENKEKLIEGRSDYDDISYRFLDLKRLGFIHLLYYCINNEKGHILFKDEYRNFENGEIIVKSPLSIFLIKLNASK